MLNFGPGFATKLFVMSQIMFIGTEKVYTFINKCLLVSNSAHSSFSTDNIKLSAVGTRRKNTGNRIIVVLFIHSGAPVLYISVF